MIIIREIAVEDAAADTPFACDLNACKGACCTMPGSKGAPLLDEEIDRLHECYPAIRHFIPAAHQEVIERRGLFEGPPGDRTTTVVNERACVFVHFENGIARCAFERGYLDGLIAWQKPVSCHLFPLRVNRSGEIEHIWLERIAECRAAYQNGADRAIPVSEFLRDALTRAYGPEWYEEFRRAADEYRRTTHSADAA